MILGTPIVHSYPFSPESYWKNIDKYRISVSFINVSNPNSLTSSCYFLKSLGVVPMLINAMNMQPAAPHLDLSSLENVLSGAAPLSDTILYKFYEVNKARTHPNMTIRQVYGLTETCESFT